MNDSDTTNATIFPIDLYTQAYIITEAQDLWITIAVSVVQMIVLIHLIVNEATASIIERKKVFTAINILLCAMIITNCLAMVFNALYIKETVPIRVVVYLALSSFCTILFECLIMVYTWKRGNPVIIAMIPSIQPYLPVFFIFYSLLQASQFTWTVLLFISNNLPILLDWRNVISETTNAHTITVSAVMLCFDTLVTSVYIFYLRSMTPDLPDVTKLKIISRYGIASCICMEAWLIGIVLFNYWFVSPSVDVSWFLVSLRAYDLGPAVYLFLQLAMKWSLVREEVRGEKVKRERVETARLVSRRGTVGQVVSTTSESMEKSRSSRAPATLSQA